MREEKKLLVTLQNRIDEARNKQSKVTTIFTSTLTECMKRIKETEPVQAEVEGGGTTWWYVCGECHGAIDTRDSFCRHCGRRISWKGCAL